MRGWENINSLEKLKARGMLVDYTSQHNNRNIVVHKNAGNVVKNNAEILKRVKGERKHEESDLQINCIKAFGLIHPKYAKRLRSIPNERESNWQKFVSMGLMAGSLDLELLVPQKNGFHGMQIELKAGKNRLEENQIAFIKEVQADYYCCVVRSVEGFLKEVKEYLYG